MPGRAGSSVRNAPPEGNDTYSVSELTEEIRDLLAEAYAGVWVAGEVGRARASRNGHLYFELIEKGRGDRIVGKIDAVLWRSHHQRIRRNLAAGGQRIADGQQIRCWGRLDFYGPAGRLQLVVHEVDPLFTLGLLEKRRRQTLAVLAEAGLLELNRQRPLPAVPLDVGLVTSEGSAAFHDFLAGLAESGYGFRVFLVHAAMQGHEAERQVAAAFRRLGALQLDAIVLIRGGGSRTDLAAFDSRQIAEAVARCPLPVLTGLGHEIDQSIADRVSHTAFKTPSKAAEFLTERVAAAERGVIACEAALGQVARRNLRRARRQLQSTERLAQMARLRLQVAARAVLVAGRTCGRISRRRLREARRATAELTRRLASSAPRLVERQRGRPRWLSRRLVDIATGRLREVEATLAGVARVCSELAPERVLERGYSITRDQADKIVREPRQVEPGDRIVTTLAGGALNSRVEEISRVEKTSRGAETSRGAKTSRVEEV